jgi:hypothetical protein
VIAPSPDVVAAASVTLAPGIVKELCGDQVIVGVTTETVIVAVAVALTYVLVALLVAATTHEPAELYVNTGVEPSAKAQLVSPAFDTE